jgi:hypothetical protein
MRILSLTLLLGIIFISCKKNKNTISTDTATLLSTNNWQLDRYTDANGKAISNTSLNAGSIALFGLVFEFKADKETRALDKLTKNVVNRGTWALIEGDKTIDINITAFKGQFKIVSITKGKLTLQTSTSTFLSGVGATVNLEFTEAK